VVVTPHVEQIREEFARAFDDWHRRNHGERVEIDWRTPGGTSDIIKALEAQFDAAASAGRIGDDGAVQPGSIGYDVFFGGGSYEHSKMKDKRATFRTVNGEKRKVEYRWGQPAGFDAAELTRLYGENKIGVQQLYDPDQYWLGAALSGFGIVYNKAVLKDLGLGEPKGFGDLCDPRYAGLLALADGRQSGSITTTYESIMNKEGWERGWRTLREMSANARYFASASTKPPVDVSQGDAAAGLAIDFYGRGQAQFVQARGTTGEAGGSGDSRVGYVDPEGAAYIDADPVSIINGASDAELCRRFVRFALTEEGQALWQFPSKSDPRSASNPIGESGERMGPARYELRRMPARRVMYEKYAQHMIDKADPFKIAADVPNRGWRPAIAPLMAAFGIDSSEECRAAWRALNNAREQERSGGGAAGGDQRITHEFIVVMEQEFYAMPEHQMQQGTIWWPDEITKGLSKDAAKELEKQRVTTFAELERAIERAKQDGKTAPPILDEWRGVIALKDRFGQAAPKIELSEKTYRAIRNDTDSWRSPEHGRRTLIAYTEFFRRKYKEVVELRERGAGHPVIPFDQDDTTKTSTGAAQ
jgi:ABC-type Fe3+ transport system substrate-binding protein